MLALVQQINTAVTDLSDKLDTLVETGFPDGDPSLHRRLHEATTRKAEKSAAFWELLLAELAKYGLIAFAGWAIYALWQAFISGFLHK